MRTDVSTSKYSFFSTRGLVTTAVAFLLPFLFVFAGVAMACTGGCCPAAPATVAFQTCGDTPNMISIVASTGAGAGEITCTLTYDWDGSASCGPGDRNVRYCVQLRSREGSPCDDNVVDFICADELEAWGTITYTHIFTAAAQTCYYCVMKAADHITGGGGGGCPTCDSTNCYNGGNCTTTLTGGTSTCAISGI